MVLGRPLPQGGPADPYLKVVRPTRTPRRSGRPLPQGGLADPYPKEGGVMVWDPSPLPDPLHFPEVPGSLGAALGSRWVLAFDRNCRDRPGWEVPRGDRLCFRGRHQGGGGRKPNGRLGGSTGSFKSYASMIVWNGVYGIILIIYNVSFLYNLRGGLKGLRRPPAAKRAASWLASPPSQSKPGKNPPSSGSR